MNENDKNPQFESAKTGYKSTIESTRYAGPLVKGYRLGESYVLVKYLGSGGMGEVWLADQMHIDAAGNESVSRQVVVKVVPPHVQDAKEEMARVRGSFQTVHGLQHEHICPTHSLEQDAIYGFFLVMKYVDGPKLSEYKNSFPGGKIPLPKALEILKPIADALDYAHRKKVIHRDIKPQNIMIDKNDGVQIIDFGLADEIRTSMSRVTNLRAEPSGTIHFMAPEQWESAYQDAKTDQFALGVTTFLILTGDYPFRAPQHEVLHVQIKSMPVPRIEPLTEAVHTVLSRAMAKLQQERFPTCGDFYIALKNAVENPLRKLTPDRPKRKYGLGTLATLFFTVFLTIFLASFFLNASRRPAPVDPDADHLPWADAGLEPPIIQAVESGNLPKIQSLLNENPNLRNSQKNSTGQTLLHLAAFHGHFDIADWLLDFMRTNDDFHDNVKAFVNTTDYAGRTAIHDAVESGSGDVVSLLIENGANVNLPCRLQQAPVHLAVNGRHVDVLKSLLENAAEIDVANAAGETPFYLAVRNHSGECVETLLAAGADPREETPTGGSLYEVANAEIKTLLRDKMTQEKSIFEAVKEGNRDIVRTWIDLEPASVNRSDDETQTPLFFAIQGDWFDIAALLIEHGADVDARNAFGETPLYLAVEKSPAKLSERFVKLLLDHDADPFAGTPDGKSLPEFARNEAVKTLLQEKSIRSKTMFQAVKEGRPDIARQLVSIDPEIIAKRDAEGQTPLHVAVLNDSGDFVEMLLDAGADPLVETLDGKIPLEIAGSQKVKRLILDRIKSQPMTIFDAVQSENPALVRQWVAVEPESVDARDEHGMTPLHLAIQNESKDIANILLDAGGDVNAPNAVGESPLFSAVKNDCIESVQWLLAETGADRYMKTPDGKNLLLANAESELMKQTLRAALAPNVSLLEAIESDDRETIRRWGDFQLPETARVLLIQAKMRETSGQPDKAEEYYLLAMDIARHHYAEPCRHYVNFLKATCDDYDKIEVKLERIFDAHCDDTILVLNLMECRIATNKTSLWDRTMTDYENTREKDKPGNRLAHVFFQYLTRQGQRDEHAATLEQLLKTKTANDAWNMERLLERLDMENDPDREFVEDFAKRISGR